MYTWWYTDVDIYYIALTWYFRNGRGSVRWVCTGICGSFLWCFSRQSEKKIYPRFVDSVTWNSPFFYGLMLFHHAHIHIIALLTYKPNYFAENTAKCQNPGPVENAIQKVTDASIAAGQYFKYECIKGYELASGNLGQACTRNGLVMGPLPVCQRVYNFLWGFYFPGWIFIT